MNINNILCPKKCNILLEIIYYIPPTFCGQTEDLRILVLNSGTEIPTNIPLQEQNKLNAHLFHCVENSEKREVRLTLAYD